MSYILDALRRAESERERGSLPTLHGQATAAARPLAAGEEGAAKASRLVLWLILLALVLGLLALGLYFWPRGGEPAASSGPQVAPRAQTQTQAQQPAPLTQAPAVPPVTVALPSAPAPAPAPVAVAAVPQPITKAAPAAQAPTAEGPLPSKDGLPEALRRELPPLVTGGAMYSDTPANRMLIINSQVWHEGDKIAPNLTLEQIRLRSAVLAFKGQRFTLAY
ncbi:general secretion pathway protein B [Paucibacter oligotrophus]|uniref:General secretion pathway protein B n=1 Tax=Roseateles oligotrophus TaxID=1769250 RepID=A0A840LI18_9BURK|nr:general secretion pathway protein GspB [Roseateles oligotrophus]MBB4845848.1 general secretion pathway protein B [Roseateles oligotrophus]